MYICLVKYNSFYSNTIVLMCVLCVLFLVFLVIQFRFCHLFKKGEIVELHSMLLTISPFMFWDDSKIFFESIISLLVLAKNGILRLLSANA